MQETPNPIDDIIAQIIDREHNLRSRRVQQAIAATPSYDAAMRLLSVNDQLHLQIIEWRLMVQSYCALPKEREDLLQTQQLVLRLQIEHRWVIQCLEYG